MQYQEHNIIVCSILQERCYCQKISIQKTQGVIGKFGEVVIGEGLIDRKYGKYLSKAFELRTLSDYDVFYFPKKKEEVEEIIEHAEEFLNTIKKAFEGMINMHDRTLSYFLKNLRKKFGDKIK
jgi:hypothetical protein